MQLSLLLCLLVSILCVSAIQEDINGFPRNCVGKPTGFKVTDPTDCTGYFLCHQDMLQHYCPSGTKFIEALQTCVVGKCPACDCDCTTCQQTPGPGPGPEGNPPNCQFVPNGTLLPHSVHCRLFWQCVNLEAVLRFCEIGMWYDRTRYVCNYPKLVQNCPENLD